MCACRVCSDRREGLAVTPKAGIDGGLIFQHRHT